MELFLFENYLHSSPKLSSKNNSTLKNIQRNKCLSIHEIIRLIIMKMKMTMLNTSHRQDINRPRSRHGHKYGKCKKCLTMMMLACIKQHLSNTWSSIYEKVKQLWGWVEKHFKRQKFEERNIKIIINIWRCTLVLTLSQFWEYDIEKPNLSKNLQGKKMKK